MHRRWKLSVSYRTDKGQKLEEHLLEELSQVDEIVEKGPHWDTIIDIYITRYEPDFPTLTIEQAEKM